MKKKVFILQPYKPTWGLLFNELSNFQDIELWVIYASQPEPRRKGSKKYYHNVKFNEIQLNTKVVNVDFEHNKDSYNYFQMLKLLIKYKPHVIISGGNKLDRFIGIFKQVLKIKFILWSETNEVTSLGKKYSTLSKSLYYKKLDAIVTVSEKSREYHKTLEFLPNRVKYFLAPYTVDDLLFRATKNEIVRKFSKIDPIMITFSGSFIDRKGFHVLKAAVKELHKKNDIPKFIVNCLGNDKIDENIDNMQALGFLERDKYAKFFRRSHIFILPSLSEGYGVVVLEAVKTGNIILVSDGVGSSKDLCQDNGIVFQRNSVEAIVEALEKVLNLSREEMLKKALRSLEISKEITHENSAKAFKEAINFVLE